MKLSNIKSEHHRNGVAGESFHVVTFDMKAGNGRSGTRRMVGIVFGEPGQCAVLDIDLLSKGDIDFASNSWRGEMFEHELRAAIEHKRMTDSGR